MWESGESLEGQGTGRKKVFERLFVPVMKSCLLNCGKTEKNVGHKAFFEKYLKFLKFLIFHMPSVEKIYMENYRYLSKMSQVSKLYIHKLFKNFP